FPWRGHTRLSVSRRADGHHFCIQKRAAVALARKPKRPHGLPRREPSECCASTSYRGKTRSRPEFSCPWALARRISAARTAEQIRLWQHRFFGATWPIFRCAFADASWQVVRVVRETPPGPRVSLRSPERIRRTGSCCFRWRASANRHRQVLVLERVG